MLNSIRNNTLITFGIAFAELGFCLTFRIQPNSDIVGGMQTAIVQKNESLADIARKFDFGVYEMMEANPKVDPWFPAVGTKVIIPSLFILPSGRREGIIINLAEMRLYFFHPDGIAVTTHPIGPGRRGWSTPLITCRIVEKMKDPVWRPPQSIRASHKRKGKILPRVVPAGPKNPLGRYAMRLSQRNYLIHGTNRPGGIGLRSSSGCIRMFAEDIESLFYKVPLQTLVRIIHEPYKIGYHYGEQYIEVHEPLSESKYEGGDSMRKLTELFSNFNNDSFEINWGRVEKAIKRSKGYPILLRKFLLNNS